MKIFNWMHKRFLHHNTLKDGFASNMKKTEPTTNNVDSQALLKQVALNDLLGGWKDGILTIGTLGYDPFKSNINHHKEYFALETEQHEGEEDRILVDDDDDRYNENCYNTDEHEELNPLMHNTFEHNFDIIVNASKEIVLAPLPVISHEIMESNNAETDEQKKKKGERITLADLFLADSDVKIKLDYPAKVLLEKSTEKQSLKAKHGLSFAKKLIPRVKDHPHPMRDIKKLMKKSLKRKIHPDLEVKNQKPENQEVTAAGIVDNHKNESNNSTYFLPI